MAASYAGFEQFNDFLYTAIVDRNRQHIENFNAATAGAITISPDPKIGDRHTEVFYNRVPDVVIDRDPKTETILTNTEVTQSEIRGVRHYEGTKLLKIDKGALDTIRQSTAAGAAILAEQEANAMMHSRINTIISVAYAASRSNDVSGSYLDKAGTTAAAASRQISLDMMHETTGLLGDAEQDGALWVMHSKVYNRLKRSLIASSSLVNLFQYDNYRIVQVDGKRIFVTDSPVLTYSAGSGSHAVVPRYRTLLLLRGGLRVAPQNDFSVRTDTPIEVTNFPMRRRSEWSTFYFASSRTYIGTATATKTELGKHSNWNGVGLEPVKSGPGVVLTSQA